MEQIPLVYIGGCGHAGSTLLDLIIGSHPKVVSVGEIQHYNPSSGNSLCSCGEKVSDCTFWKKVKDTFFSKKSILGHSIEKHYLKSIPYLSWRNFMRWTNIYYPYFKGKEREEYALDYYLLFISILEVAGKNIVLDSSKVPTRSLYLYESGYFSMKIIYLMRNGKAFINSFRKKGEPNFKAATYWTLRNYRMRKIIRNKFKKNNVLEVHYESIVSKPEMEITRICNFLGITYRDEMLKFRNMPHHIVGGNPMRNNMDDTIKNDQSWEKNLSILDILLFEIIAGNMNKKLGY